MQDILALLQTFFFFCFVLFCFVFFFFLFLCKESAEAADSSMEVVSIQLGEDEESEEDEEMAKVKPPSKKNKGLSTVELLIQSLLQIHQSKQDYIQPTDDDYTMTADDDECCSSEEEEEEDDDEEQREYNFQILTDCLVRDDWRIWMGMLFPKCYNSSISFSEREAVRFFQSFVVTPSRIPLQDQNPCLLWKSKRKMFKMYSIDTKKDIHCRTLIYLFCVGDCERNSVIQQCGRTEVCVQPAHLRKKYNDRVV